MSFYFKEQEECMSYLLTYYLFTYGILIESIQNYLLAKSLHKQTENLSTFNRAKERKQRRKENGKMEEERTK